MQYWHNPGTFQHGEQPACSCLMIQHDCQSSSYHICIPGYKMEKGVKKGIISPFWMCPTKNITLYLMAIIGLHATSSMYTKLE